MLIGVPREIKVRENRVGLNPESVKRLVEAGHGVLVESSAGAGIGADDADYISAGAQIASHSDDVFSKAEMIIKVKEPQESEWQRLKPDQILFTYLHLAPDLRQARGLVESGCVAIAYETVTDKNGRLPLLAPMSEVAGRMAPQMAAYFSQGHFGGHGCLFSGVSGTRRAKVVVIGGGVAGMNAAKIALGLGADVTLFEKFPERVAELSQMFGDGVTVKLSDQDEIEADVLQADVVIGAVLVAGGSAPKLVSEKTVAAMKRGAVLVDIAIDQGGCFETSKATTHDSPTYILHDVVHYCVANMPGAYPETSTAALNNATLPYILDLANKGWKRACADDPYLAAGLNVINGKITNKAVATALDLPYNPVQL